MRHKNSHVTKGKRRPRAACVRIVLLGSSLFAAVDVHAIALGDIEVESYLNQPFAATVRARVGSNERVTAGCVRLTLPPGRDERELGINYLRDATIQISGQGRDRVLRIRSRERVVDPVLGLVLRVDCPGTGAMLREYTALLDPHLPRGLQPAYSRVPPAPRAVPVRPVAAEPPAPSPQAGAAWRVQPGENLSRIAATLAPGNRRAQMRLIDAIVAANPAVFPGGDPNRLPAGAVLQIPGVDAGAAAQAATGGPAAGVAPGATAVTRQEDAAPRLTLTNSEQVTDLKSADETARMVAESRRLLLETESQYADTAALKARLQRLEKQIALLEQALQTAGQPAETASAAAPEPTGAESARMPPVADVVAPESMPVQPKPSTAPTAQQAPVEVASANVAAPQVEQPQPRRNYWWWLAGVLLVGGGLLAWRMRSAARAQQSDDAVVEWQLDQLVPEPAGVSAQRNVRPSGNVLDGSAPDLSHKETVFNLDPLANLPENGETEPEPADEIPTLDHELTQQMDNQELLVETFDFEEPQSAVKPELGNVLVRAEFYLLLRQPENAIRLLREAIEGGEPLSSEPAVWLMLLRVYRQERMRDTFDKLHVEFNQLFNIAVPEWDETDNGAGEKTLERDFPRILNRIVSLWESPHCAEFLASLLRDDREGTRHGFDLGVAEELLLLKGVWRLRRPH